MAFLIVKEHGTSSMEVYTGAEKSSCGVGVRSRTAGGAMTSLSVKKYSNK